MLKALNYKDITIRELARCAGVNSAMISYHFGSKEALFVEVIQQGLNSSGVESESQLPAESGPEASAKELLQLEVGRFVRLHRQHPWLARLLIDQVVLKEGKLRDLFVEKVVQNNGAQLHSMIETLQRQGVLRRELDPQALRISLLALTAFPFVASPVLEQAFGFDIHDQDMEEWIKYTTELFLHGAAGPRTTTTTV